MGYQMFPVFISCNQLNGNTFHDLFQLRVKLQLWDTVGQEHFRCIARSFYQNMVGILPVFDVTNRKSFDHIRDGHEEVMAIPGPDKAVFVLVGHRVTCRATQAAEELAASLGMACVEMSARSHSSVDLAFHSLVDTIQQALRQGATKLEEDWGSVCFIHKTQSPGGPPKRKPCPGPCQCGSGERASSNSANSFPLPGRPPHLFLTFYSKTYIKNLLE
ncbi:ras-related protein Rab-42-like [Echinops telfairi]|uniref:small monomeric GTPase n=1 Tax=Echinops telfairi TaxID=9371 RepID=A0ABM1VJF1_ECHTE|nr:ras-related protein Rab-42-like [Echinops telfairi]